MKYIQNMWPTKLYDVWSDISLPNIGLPDGKEADVVLLMTIPVKIKQTLNTLYLR